MTIQNSIDITLPILICKEIAFASFLPMTSFYNLQYINILTKAQPTSLRAKRGNLYLVSCRRLILAVRRKLSIPLNIRKLKNELFHSKKSIFSLEKLKIRHTCIFPKTIVILQKYNKSDDYSQSYLRHSIQIHDERQQSGKDLFVGHHW